jgi:hypothetical protein
MCAVPTADAVAAGCAAAGLDGLQCQGAASGGCDAGSHGGAHSSLLPFPTCPSAPPPQCPPVIAPPWPVLNRELHAVEVVMHPVQQSALHVHLGSVLHAGRG